MHQARKLWRLFLSLTILAGLLHFYPSSKVFAASPSATINVEKTLLGIGSTSKVTITFSEAVIGFGLDDLMTDNGTLSALTTSDNIAWTLILTPVAGITSGHNVIELNNAGVTDKNGIPGAGTTQSNNYVIDQLPPTSTMVLINPTLRAGETSLVTITFSEAVMGLNNDSLTVADGKLSDVSSSDGGITWNATFTPNTDIIKTNNLISLKNSTITDLAGNVGTGVTNSAPYDINTVRPIANITIADNKLIQGKTSLVKITFSEAVSGFSNEDLTVNNGTLSNVASSDGGITWTATLAPSVNIEETDNTITLNNTGVTNAAGNTGIGITESNKYLIDTLRPTSRIEVTNTELQGDDSSLVKITFSEPVSGFSNEDLTVDNGTLSEVTPSEDGITWTATLTPAVGIEAASNFITLDNTGVSDIAGNAGEEITKSNSYAIHTMPISVDLGSLTLSSGNLSPIFTSDTESYTSSVPYSVSDLTVTASVVNSKASIKVNDHPVTNGQPSGRINLDVGNNHITIVVTGNPGSTRTYSLNVLRANPPSPSTTPSHSDLPESTIKVKLDGMDESAKVTKEITSDGLSATKVTIDTQQLIKAFAAAQSSVITLEIKAADPVVTVSLPAAALMDEASKHPNTIIKIKVDGASYSLPVRIWNNLTKDDEVTVTIAKLTGKEKDAVTAAAENAGLLLLLDNPFDFIVRVNGKEITDFNGVYIDRSLTLNAAVDGNQATAVWVDENHIMHYIPSIITSSNGSTEVTIHSPHNSVYTVIQSNHSFADLQGHWAKSDIEILANKLIVNGINGSSFAPNTLITRAEFTAMLVHSLGLIEVKSDNPFTDVKVTDWFAGAVGAAQKASLINGYVDGAFQPDATITREQMAVMIIRALKFGGKELQGSELLLYNFSDRDSIANWAKAPIAQTLTANIVQGLTPTTFGAKELATRAEAAVLLKRMLSYLQFIN